MFGRAGGLRAIVKSQKVRLSSLGRRTEVLLPAHNGRTAPEQGNRLRNSTQSCLQREENPVDMPSLLWYQHLGAVSGFFNWYDRTQSQSPYWTQLFSSPLVYVIGDQLSQGVGGEPYDGRRTCRHLTQSSRFVVESLTTSKTGSSLSGTTSTTPQSLSLWPRRSSCTRRSLSQSSTSTFSVCKPYSPETTYAV